MSEGKGRHGVEKAFRVSGFIEHVARAKMRRPPAILIIHAVAEHKRFAAWMRCVKISQDRQSTAAAQSDIQYHDIGVDAANALDRIVRRCEFAAYNQVGDLTQHPS